MNCTKADLINMLGAVHRYRSYLELCTGTTGHLFAKVDRNIYTTCDRLMYRCHKDFDDGLPVTYRCEGEDIRNVVDSIRSTGQRYDAILVDPHHTYDISQRDIRAALSLLSARGTIVVHDCFPLEREIATPDFIPGSWCGVTYKAYLDVVCSDPGLVYCTVDTDYGCGIIRFEKTLPILQRLKRRLPMLSDMTEQDAVIRRRWSSIKSDYDEAFTFLHENAVSLLQLVKPDEFFLGERHGVTRLK